MLPSAFRVKPIIWFFITLLSTAYRCAAFVQKRNYLPPPVDKYRFSNALHFPLFTALPTAVAPIVCVDVFRFSVKVSFVDGRKGKRIKLAGPM
jgi:hypothetical protein